MSADFAPNDLKEYGWHCVLHKVPRCFHAKLFCRMRMSKEECPPEALRCCAKDLK